MNSNNMPPCTRFPQAHKLPLWMREDIEASIRRALNDNPKAVERAISILYSRQTEAEKEAGGTFVDNGVGVRGGHGGRVKYYGEWIASGRRLTGIHLERARKLAHNYARTQLLEVAALKAGLI